MKNDIISFCIITNGKKSDKTKLCIKSIHNCMKEWYRYDTNYEIVIVGNNIEQFSGDNIKLVEDNEFTKFLGKRKNIGTENSIGDVIVHCDDDVLFESKWFENLCNFRDLEDDWKILGCKFLFPDGSRCWDRNTFFPVHRMVSYDFYSDSHTFYQTGGFSISKRKLFDEIRWDESIEFYNAKNTGSNSSNEDVEFSLRLKQIGVKIFFDKNNTVWHYDRNYISNNIYCVRKRNNNPNCEEFEKLLNELQ
jgi:hypothetical protein